MSGPYGRGREDGGLPPHDPYLPPGTTQRDLDRQLWDDDREPEDDEPTFPEPDEQPEDFPDDHNDPTQGFDYDWTPEWPE